MMQKQVGNCGKAVGGSGREDVAKPRLDSVNFKNDINQVAPCT